jgi:hypothetical protein
MQSRKARRWGIGWDKSLMIKKKAWVGGVAHVVERLSACLARVRP